MIHPVGEAVSPGGGAGAVLGERPQAGLGLHFTSLPSPHGIGDIGEAALAFLDALVAMKLRVWQFLPTGPTAYGDSPYQPLSAFAGNENLIGLEPLERDGYLEAHELESLQDLPRHRVDYGALIPRKAALLARAADRFLSRAGSAGRTAFEAFLEDNGAAWLDDYALFRILKAQHGERPWPEWSPEFVHREPSALQRFRDRHAHALDVIRVQQFFFDAQWRHLKRVAREKGVRLFGDMPIYIALDSADAWAHPELLRVARDGRPEAVAGVPPDYFSADGQLWGNPLYDWDFHARQDFRWWVDRIRRAARQNDLVRIDHFRGFEAYWAVPFGHTTAREGRWEPGPGDALFEAVERQLGSLPIVAEDLGVITPKVDALRRGHRIPGMVVLQFSVDDPAFDPRAMDPHSVCYTGTHDNDTTLGWFEGGQDDTRSDRELRCTRENALRLTDGAPETIHLDLIELAFSTPARLAVAPLQDFLGLGSEARFNIPGTTRDNWRWRLLPAQLSDAVQGGVARLVEAAGRG